MIETVARVNLMVNEVLKIKKNRLLRLLKKIHQPQRERLSNAEAMIGQTGRVSESIEAGGYGRVAIDGDDWKAKSADGCAIDKDVRVRVVKMDSIILTVEPLNTVNE